MASLSDVVKGIQSTNDLLVENVKGQNRTAAMITSFVTGQQSSFGDKLEAGREKGKSKISTRATAVPKGGSKSNLMSGSGLSGLLKGAGGLLALVIDLKPEEKVANRLRQLLDLQGDREGRRDSEQEL